MKACLNGYLLAVLLQFHAAAAPDTSLRYSKPARNWETEALPIGNGRLGAMIFGDPARERIQFNEESLWIGDEVDTGAYQAFGDVIVELGGQGAEIEIGEKNTPVLKGYRCARGRDKPSFWMNASPPSLRARSGVSSGRHQHFPFSTPQVIPADPHSAVTEIRS
jgi:hypothetical protein